MGLLAVLISLFCGFWVVAFDGEMTFSDVDGDFSDVKPYFSDVIPKKSDWATAQSTQIEKRPNKLGRLP